MNDKWFSVKGDMSIGGVKFKSGVCYKVQSGHEKVIEELASKKMAAVYDTEVRFVTGVPIPIRKNTSSQQRQTVRTTEPRVQLSTPAPEVPSASGDAAEPLVESVRRKPRQGRF